MGIKVSHVISVLDFLTMWYSTKETVTYLFAFLQSKQQITTKTNKNKHAEDIDQKATWIGESGSHQNWKWNILVVTNQHPNILCKIDKM